MLLLPYQIETLEQDPPWANWLIIGVCTVISLIFFSDFPTEDEFMYGEHWSLPLFLTGWNPIGMFGHVFLHLDFIHLAGNMLFLWVFGNAICTNIGNGRYLIFFAVVTLLAAVVHNIFDGDPAIGASGAINGVVGMVLAMYPINRVYAFYWIFIKYGTWEVSAWFIILIWFCFDLWGVASGGGGVAYWAHIGGLLAGLGFGVIALQNMWVRLTECDNRSLVEIMTGQDWGKT